MRYVASSPPVSGDLQDVLSWALRELEEVGKVINTLSPGTLYVAPPKPVDGMVVLADGVKWNPGGGRGFYGYDSSVGWRKLS
jgi:hypothetical protein